MMSTKRLRMILSFAALCTQLSCDSGPQLTQFNNANFPATPQALQVSIGDGQIVLSWSHPNPAQVDYFRIYRRSNIDTAFAIIDTTGLQSYVDTSVSNGIAYAYAVAAVKQGVEGARANSTLAQPTVFGVRINAGDEATNSRSVVLYLDAALGTTFMRISNDSLFVGTPWEPYQATKNWTLPDGDGTKSVFVHYRDAQQNQTLSPSFDSIVLDTKATILSVTEDTGGQPKNKGDTINFTLNSGEAKGAASIIIAQATTVKLYDDGTNGDDVPGDGIYKRSYQIPSGLEVVNARAAGNFSDQLGNVAETLETPGRISIQNAPTAVALVGVDAIAGSPNSLSITWTQNTDPDFASYKLYRAQAPGVTSASTLVAAINTSTTLNFMDSNLQENTVYYYRVFVVDQGGLSTGSNELSGTPQINVAPDAVILLPPEPIAGSFTSLNITWTQSNATDFASYKLYRSSSPGVSTSSTFVTSISNPQVLSYVDNNLVGSTLYYYRLFVFDTGGLNAGSNEVSATTLTDAAPKAVTLTQPTPIGGTTLRLAWSQSSASDFESYRIYRSTSSPVDTTVAPIGIINNQTTTTFDDANIQTLTTYFYRVLVFDLNGSSTGSNEVSGQVN